MVVRPSFILGIAVGIALSGALLFLMGDAVPGGADTGANLGASADTFVAHGATEVSGKVAQGATKVPPKLAPVPGSRDTEYSGSFDGVSSAISTPVPKIALSPTVTPGPTPSPSKTPTISIPSPSASPTPSVTVTPSPTPEPTAEPTPVPSSTPEPDFGLTLVINEIAWAGTSATPNGEWIELFNASDDELDLSDFALVWLKSSDEQAFLNLDGTLPSGGYFLIERTTSGSPDPIEDIVGDLELNFGPFKLNNDGAYIVVVRMSDGDVVDGVDGQGGWAAGMSEGRYSMERIDPTRPGSPDNWATNDGITVNGTDAAGSPINGTPRSRNSASVN